MIKGAPCPTDMTLCSAGQFFSKFLSYYSIVTSSTMDIINEPQSWLVKWAKMYKASRANATFFFIANHDLSKAR